MKKKEKRDDLRDVIEPVVHGLGFRIADVSTRRAQGILEIHVVLAKHGGISLDDCSLVHTTILPKLELEYPDLDLRLEVSSPGINRVIKWFDELPAYTGMTLNLLPAENETWVRGTLREAGDTFLVLGIQEENRRFDMDLIRKIKLESMEEAEK